MNGPAPAGLLLVAHGSRDPAAAPVALEVAAAVAEKLSGVRVEAAFLELARPDPEAALSALAGSGVRHVLVQPFLLGNAYHSKVDLPEVLRTAVRLGMTAEAGRVLAPAPVLADALLDRLAAVPALRTGYDALVLAAAGSSDPEGNAHVAGLANLLSDRLGLPVTAAYASATAPTVADAVRRSRGGGAERVAVATYLLAPGYFADTIRRSALEAGAVAVSPPLGACRQVVGLVLDRAGPLLRT